MIRKRTRAGLVVRYITATAVALIAMTVFILFIDRILDSNVRDYSKGWQVSFSGKTVKNADLYTYRFDRAIKKGDMIILNKRLPRTLGEDVILSFDGELSAVTVNVDGITTYSYGYDLLRKKQTPGSGLHMALLPTNAAGRECCITITPGIDNAFRVLSPVRLVPAKNKVGCYSYMHVATNTAAFLLFTFGAVLMLLSIAVGIRGRSYGLTFSIGALAFISAVWTMCFTHMVEMFSADFYVNTLLEYLSAYTLVLPFMSILYLIRKPGKRRYQRICGRIAGIISVVFAASSWIFILTGLVHPADLMILSQLMILAVIILMILAYDRTAAKRSSPVLIDDLAILVLSAGYLADMLRKYLAVYIRIRSRALFYSFLPQIILCFIILIGAAHLIRLKNKAMSKATREIGEEIAFRDAVTGLYNRTYCNDLFERLTGEEAPLSYQIVCFNINGVSKTNDTFGREAGDMLIMDAAKIIRDSFSWCGTVIRMGGDEFIVLIENGSYRDVKTSLSRMKRLEARYEFRRKYDIRISYGAASSDERAARSPEDVYNRAEARLYAMKKETSYGKYL